MEIVLFFRNPTIGPSLNKFLDPVIPEIKKEASVKIIHQPSPNSKIIDIIKNGIYTFKHRAKNGGINHITGDTHYLTYFLPRKRTIVTVHDIGLIDILKPPKRWIWHFFWINSLKRAAKIVCVSEKTKIEILKHTKIKEDKFEVIPNVLKDYFKPNKKEFNTEKPRILHIGIGPNKNLLRTIKALNSINCHLRIIGHLNDKEIFAALKENNIDYTIAYNLTTEEIINEYNNCDILNFPSTFEGFGLPITEAQTVGRNVITSNIEPTKSVAGKGAILIDPYNIPSIRDGYLKIISDEQLRQNLINEGFENIKRFDKDTIANQYINTYKSVYIKQQQTF